MQKTGNGNKVSISYTYFRSVKLGRFEVLSNDFRKTVQNTEAINECLINMGLKMYNHNYSCCIFATNDSDMIRKITLFEQLTLILNRIGSSKQEVLMTDFNNHVGSKINILIAGHYGKR